jgi:hypothetical protein
VALAEDFQRSNICRMTLAQEEFFTVEMAFIVQKESPFLELINYEYYGGKKYSISLILYAEYN